MRMLGSERGLEEAYKEQKVNCEMKMNVIIIETVAAKTTYQNSNKG